VKLLKTSFVWALIAFWALVTNHCMLETILQLDFLRCSTETESSDHQSSDCRDDACDSVESGAYKSEANRISVERPSFAFETFALALFFKLAASEASANIAAADGTPPEFVPTWQFSFRTALPVRAFAEDYSRFVRRMFAPVGSSYSVLVCRVGAVPVF
jgi:hypothetical protein